MVVCRDAGAHLQQVLRLLDAMSAQLLDQHCRQRDRAASAGLSFLLSASRLGLFGAGDDGELPGFEIERAPSQGCYLAPPQSTELCSIQRSRNAATVRRVSSR